MNNFAMKIIHFQMNCMTQTLVFSKKEFITMKEFVSDPGSINTKDPNIRYFNETNPGWKEGHQIVTVCVANPLDIIFIVY